MAVSAPIEPAAILKESLIAGAIAFVAALPLLGFQLVDSAHGPILTPRLSWAVIAAGVVFLGRLAMAAGRGVDLRAILARRPPPRPSPQGGGSSSVKSPPLNGEGQGGVAGNAIVARLGRLARRPNLALGWLLVIGAVVLPMFPFIGQDVVDHLTLLLIYVMLGWGLNIVVGLAGLLDFGYVAFYAIGAYSYALLSQDFGWSFWVCLPLAGLFASLFGILLGFPVLRLRGDYLAIVTLGFGEIVRVVLLNWSDLTGGPNGITDIARPTLFGLVFQAPRTVGPESFSQFFGIPYSPAQRVVFLYYLILALALVTNLFVLRIRRLPIGRAWEALREDEIACRSLGINPTLVKLSAFALGAGFAGFAGSFFAAREAFISPDSFTFLESAIILAIVVLGGAGSQIGVVIAAVILVALPEWFRQLELYRMLAFGGAMVLIMRWRPRGIMAWREPAVRLSRR